MEILGATVSWKALAGLAGIAWAAWRGRKVREAVKEWNDLRQAIFEARAETSPGGRGYTQEEVEKIIDEGGQALRVLAPVFGRLFAKR